MEKKSEDKILSISIKQNTSDLNKARSTIVDFLTASGIIEDEVSRIELAAYEVMINIIDHAPESYRSHDIKLTCLVVSETTTITIKSFGDKFDLTKKKLPDIAAHYREGKKRGLGIYFIRTLMDKVKYSYKDKISTTTLIRKK